jgi:hypothetical protein
VLSSNSHFGKSHWQNWLEKAASPSETCGFGPKKPFHATLAGKVGLL